MAHKLLQISISSTRCLFVKRARHADFCLDGLQASLRRLIKADGLAHMTAFNLPEDEVLALHPVPEVESPALRGLTDTAKSLAACATWEAADVRKDAQPRLAISLGALRAAYAAGLATDVQLFIAHSRPTGSQLA